MIDSGLRKSFGELMWEVRDWVEESEDREEDFLGFWEEFFLYEQDDDQRIQGALAGLPDDIFAWATALCVEAFLHESGSDPSAAEAFIESRPDLSELATEYLRSLKRSSSSCYEVIECSPGCSIKIQDLIRGGEPWVVPEVAGSTALTPGSIFAGRLVLVREQPVLSGFLVPLVSEVAEKIAEVTGLVVRGLSEDDSAREIADAPATAETWKDALAFVPSLAVCHWLRTECDPTEFADTDDFVELRFRLKVTEGQMVAKLERLRDLRPANDGSKAWFLHAGKKPTDPPLAFVAVDAGDLVIGANSLKRAKQMATRLERELRMKLGKATRSLVPRDRLRLEDLEFSAEERREIASILAKSVIEALDEPSPKLAGRTLRQAAANERDRPAVVRIVKELENRIRQMAPGLNLDGGSLTAAIWRELGLDPITGTTVAASPPRIRRGRIRANENVPLPFASD